MSKPRVSIILSSYNHADFIGKSIESILNQTYSDFELLIIDDCSSDNSWEIINSYNDPRIIAIRNEKNLGVVIRPETIEQLKGEYFAIAHCDDEWESTKLAKQVSFLDKNPDYAACFTTVQPIDEEGKAFADKSHFYYSVFEQKNRSRMEWLKQFFYHGNVLCHPSMMMRTNAQKKYDLYAFGCSALPDEYRWVKLCLHENIYVIQEKLTFFRVRNNEMNTSGDRLDNILRLHFERFSILDSFKEITKYDEQDFLKVFPTGKQFMKKGIKNDLDYVFSRILINMEGDKAYQLYGLKMLWDMFRDSLQKKNLEEKYDFTHKDFIMLSGSMDLFGIQNESNTLTSIIFYDNGKGFSSENMIQKNIYVNGRRKFYAEFDLSRVKEKIIQLRFDPTHGGYYIFKNLRFAIDGEEVKYKPMNAARRSDGAIVFNVSNPQIIIDRVTKNGKLVVSGEVWPRDYNEIDGLINGPLYQMQGLLKAGIRKFHK